MLFLLVVITSATLSLAIDLAVGHLSGPIPIIGDFLRLTLTHNSGIAFGIAMPSPWQEILILCALIAVSVVAVTSANNKMSSIAFGLIIGGAVANLIDRAMHGSVTDFIAIGTFPVFNLADACISIGAGMMLLEWWMQRKRAGR